MSLDLVSFSEKLRGIRQTFGESVASLSAATGISQETLGKFESGSLTPSGDEVLVLADHFLCDFRFFISNEKSAPIERADKLFRAHSKDLSTQDKWAIQEFMFLCECESFLLQQLGRQQVSFEFEKRGSFFKRHGTDGAKALRTKLLLRPTEVPEVFSALRKLGIHVFRRRLENKNISGLFLNHPNAGRCVLVNYDEDVYRQRFTAAHEAAHAIFDIQDEYVLSFTRWDKDDLREVRANAFAGAFLVPPALLSSIAKGSWTEPRILEIADQLGVNVGVLLIALERDGHIKNAQVNSLRLARDAKEDPELPSSLPKNSRERRRELLSRGISTFYAELCFEAYTSKLISGARLAEMMLISQGDLEEIFSLFGSRRHLVE